MTPFQVFRRFLYQKNPCDGGVQVKVRRRGRDIFLNVEGSGLPMSVENISRKMIRTRLKEGQSLQRSGYRFKTIGQY